MSLLHCLCRNTIKQQVDKSTSLHDQSQYHKDAVMLSLAFCEAVDNPEATIPYKISAMAKKAYDRNFHILKVITKAIILCGKQNIRLRGHRDDYTSVAPIKVIL